MDGCWGVGGSFYARNRCILINLFKKPGTNIYCSAAKRVGKIFKEIPVKNAKQLKVPRGRRAISHFSRRKLFADNGGGKEKINSKLHRPALG